MIAELLISLVILIASLVHAVMGFGFAQVSMGLLPFIIESSKASVIFTMLAVMTNSRVFYGLRQDFDKKRLIKPLTGLIIGLPIGLLLFSGLSNEQLSIGIGLTILLSVLIMVLIKRELIGKINKKLLNHWFSGFIAGLLSGFLGGAVAIPGPPIILYTSFMMASNQWSSRESKAVLTSFFGLLMSYRLIILLISGFVTIELLIQTLIATPALLLGSYLGLMISNKIPEEKYDWLIMTGLMINGLILLF